jgi:hypothetical protein
MLVFPIEEMTAMQPALRSHARILVGLAAAAGAFGMAAVLSASYAPTARADDFSDILSAVDGDYSAGQADFTAALADFGSSSTSIDGLAAFFSGVDEYLVAAPENYFVGSVEALANDPIDSSYFDVITVASSYPIAAENAQLGFGEGDTYLVDSLTALSGGDFASAAQDLAFGFNSFDNASEYLLVGTLAALGF